MPAARELASQIAKNSPRALAKAKTLEAEYKIIPARQNTPLTQQELTAIADVGTVRDVQRDFQTAQAEKESTEHQEPTITEEAPLPPEPPATPSRYNSVPPQYRP